MIVRPWILRPWFGSLALLLAAAPAPMQDPVPPPAQEPPGGTPPEDPDEARQDPPETPPQEPPVDRAEDPTRRAQEPPAPKVDIAELEKRAKEGEPEETGVAITWTDRLKRDARITFLDRSLVDASAALDNPAGVGLRRSAAWMVLGERGTPDDRIRITRAARAETDIERCAAILALGQPGSNATAFLASLAEDRDTAAAECALYALLRTQRPEAREIVSKAAGDPKNPRSVAAAALLAFSTDPSPERVPRAARTWYELRWEAARVFGGIDGKRFAVYRVEELARSARFSAEVAVAASGSSQVPAAKDHLLSALMGGQGPTRIEAAVQAIPRAVSRLVESELWKPADMAEWSALLAAIERERCEATTPELLAVAEEILAVRWKARELLARAGRFEISGFAAVDFGSLEPAERVSACQVLGCLSDPAAQSLLDRLADDADPAVHGAYLVAKLRLGVLNAEEDVERALADRMRPEHAAVVAALCKNARESAIAERLEHFSKHKAVGGELVTVAAVLCEEKRVLGRILVRSLLASTDPPTGSRRLVLVRALARNPVEQDRAVLVDYFPQPGEEVLNKELAVGLARLADPRVRPVLRSAFWGEGFDVAVLSGMLLAEELGARGLVEDIESPPASATPATLRRAGFALGEWGGVKALTMLSQATGGSAARPELQGALLGVLGARTQ